MLLREKRGEDRYEEESSKAWLERIRIRVANRTGAESRTLATAATSMAGKRLFSCTNEKSQVTLRVLCRQPQAIKVATSDSRRGLRRNISRTATWSRLQAPILHALHTPSTIHHPPYPLSSIFPGPRLRRITGPWPRLFSLQNCQRLPGTAIDNLLLFYVDSWGIYMVMPVCVQQSGSMEHCI